jgi:polyhydroxybutyrate depolymerase
MRGHRRRVTRRGRVLASTIMQGRRWRTAAALGVLLAVAVLPAAVPAYAAPTSSPQPASATACSLTPTGGRVTESVAGGRTYHLYVPAGIAGPTAPLVVSLHGWDGNPDDHADALGLDDFANLYKVIVAYPAGVQTPLPLFGQLSTGWDYRWQSSPDITFLRSVVADVSASYCVNPDRVHADGLSMGGSMSQRLACEASDVFASVSSTVANDVEAAWQDLFSPVTFPSQPCNPDRPVAVYHSCGAADPFTGAGCEQAAATWAARNGCTNVTHLPPDDFGDARVHQPCAGGTRVVWRNWTGLGHHYLPDNPQRDQWFIELNLFYTAHQMP